MVYFMIMFRCYLPKNTKVFMCLGLVGIHANYDKGTMLLQGYQYISIGFQVRLSVRWFYKVQNFESQC